MSNFSKPPEAAIGVDSWSWKLNEIKLRETKWEYEKNSFKRIIMFLAFKSNLGCCRDEKPGESDEHLG